MKKIEMNVLKESIKVLFLILLTISCGGRLAHGQSVCDDYDEFQKLLSFYTEEEAVEFMKRRYGQDILDLPNPNTYYDLVPNTLGGTFLEPTFGFEVKLVSKNLAQINSERNHWNADNSLAFFKTHSWKLGIFDGNSGDVIKYVAFSQANMAIAKNMDAIRWHPSDPHVLTYIDKNHLRGRNIITDNDFIIESFNHGNLGASGRKLAGGDGNQLSRTTGRLLLSSQTDHTNMFVYDFQEKAVARTVLKGNQGSYFYDVEFEPIQAGKKEKAFDVPSNFEIDYGSITPSGEYLMIQYEDHGTRLYDLNGDELAVLYGVSPHLDFGYYHVNGKVLEGIVTKSVAASGEALGMNPGDLLMICWEVITDPNDGKRTVKQYVYPMLDWLNQYGPAGGGQYSTPGFTHNTTAIASLNPSVEEPIDAYGGFGVYYDETIEMSLDADDPTPRRLLHHMNSTTSPVTKQPEAWLSPDGTKMFYKSQFSNKVADNNNYLLFVNIGKRTCKAVRDSIINGLATVPDPDPDPSPTSNCTAPSSWTTIDIGDVGIAGETCEDSTGAITVKASGTDIWKQNDEFHFVYQVLSGDGEVVAKVNSVGNTHEFAKAGVMMRNGLSDGDINAMMYISPVGLWSFQRRVSKGDYSVSTKSNPGAVTFPYWVRLVRSGSVVTGYVSSNGNTWTMTDYDFLPMDNDIYVGLAVTSHNNVVTTTAEFEHVSFGSNAFTFPVEYLDFSAIPDQSRNRVDINWVTGSEENNSFFTIEKSEDGTIYQPLGQVPTQGNGSNTQEYQYYDNNPTDGTSFYRLKQTDISGAYSYSESIKVNFSSLYAPYLKVFPSPIRVGESIQMEYYLPESNSATITLYSADGRLVWSKSKPLESINHTHIGLVDTDGLTPGLYYLMVKGTHDMNTKVAEKILITN